MHTHTCKITKSPEVGITWWSKFEVGFSCPLLFSVEKWKTVLDGLRGGLGNSLHHYALMARRGFLRLFSNSSSYPRTIPYLPITRLLMIQYANTPCNSVFFLKRGLVCKVTPLTDNQLAPFPSFDLRRRSSPSLSISCSIQTDSDPSPVRIHSPAPSPSHFFRIPVNLESGKKNSTTVCLPFWSNQSISGGLLAFCLQFTLKLTLFFFFVYLPLSLSLSFHKVPISEQLCSDSEAATLMWLKS